MKTTTSLLAISFLLFAFSTVAKAVIEPVVDYKGGHVLSNTDYYIVAAKNEGEGGLRVTKGRHSQCPLDVGLSTYPSDYGLTSSFTPADRNIIVYSSTDLNIKFTTIPTDPCPRRSTVWKVDNYDNYTSNWSITTDGVEGNPGPGTLLSWFQFQKIEGQTSWYKIVYCPQVCEWCIHLCSNVSIANPGPETKVKRLTLSNESFPIQFKKVEEAHAR